MKNVDIFLSLEMKIEATVELYRQFDKACSLSSLVVNRYINTDPNQHQAHIFGDFIKSKTYPDFKSLN